MTTGLKQIRWRAFTLIELLVAIAVIAVLAGLLLPGLAQSKAAARSAKCKSNQRQLGIALRLYVGDCGEYPRSGWSRFSETWYGQLMPYALGNRPPDKVQWKFSELFPDLFLCTEGRLPGQGNASGGSFGSVVVPAKSHFSYGYNGLGTTSTSHLDNLLEGLTPERRLGLGINCREAAVESPSAMIAVGCQRAVGHFSKLIAPSGDGWFGLWEELGENHRKKVNVLVCDGHVDSLKKTNLTERSASARRLWNRDHEPHPETW